jgi:6,7-dimethyl-8-ribityllumazine synthase
VSDGRETDTAFDVEQVPPLEERAVVEAEPAADPAAAPEAEEAAPEVEAEAALPEVEEVPAEHAEGGFRIPEGYTVLEGRARGGRRAVAVAVSRFNAEITSPMLEHALEELERAGVPPEAITVMPVPGAFELPLAALALAKTRRFSCVVALGCVIRGETSHFDYVAGEAASGIQLAGIETGVPVAFGVLTCDTREQAEARVGRAVDAARSALEMADLFGQIRAAAGS